MSVKVGFQGANGTFSDIAVDKYFDGQDIVKVNYPNFLALIKDVSDGVVDYALLPVENTTTGIIARTYDLFKDFNIFANGEMTLRITHNLIVNKGTKIEDIKEVYSHPEALSQSQEFFLEHPSIKQIPYQDTAKSVEYVKSTNDKSKAALGSISAANHYDLEVLLEEVEDSKTNVTRFLCVTNHEEVKENANKVSTYCVTKHVPGSLVRLLSVLAFRGINLLKLESRPIVGKNFEYCFYIDFDGNINDQLVKDAIEDAKTNCEEFKVLGCYPKAVL